MTYWLNFFFLSLLKVRALLYIDVCVLSTHRCGARIAPLPTHWGGQPEPIIIAFSLLPSYYILHRIHIRVDRPSFPGQFMAVKHAATQTHTVHSLFFSSRFFAAQWKRTLCSSSSSFRGAALHHWCMELTRQQVYIVHSLYSSYG